MYCILALSWLLSRPDTFPTCVDVPNQVERVSYSIRVRYVEVGFPLPDFKTIRLFLEPDGSVYDVDGHGPLTGEALSAYFQHYTRSLQVVLTVKEPSLTGPQEIQRGIQVLKSGANPRVPTIIWVATLPSPR
jgi:hypothetical protein